MMSNQYAGFSLLEILIVMAIITILILASAPNYRANIKNWRHQQAELTLNDAAVRLASWLLSHGEYSSANLKQLGIKTPVGYSLKLKAAKDSYELIAKNELDNDTIIKRA